MREKELRLALICYGGISRAVYMHGITKELWRLTTVSRAHNERAPIPDPPPKSQAADIVYRKLFARIEEQSDIRLRFFPDIIAGASAGGINGVFLAHALVSGRSLEPLTELWLNNTDSDRLLAADARPLSRFTKFWATPIAWMLARKRGRMIEKTANKAAHDEVERKLVRFVRSRWFEPPFSGELFSTYILEAFDSMAAAPAGKRLVPARQPVDLFLTVTDFAGYQMPLAIHSPSHVYEDDHRLTWHFRSDAAAGSNLDDAVALTAAARATASFPGAFAPFSIREMDRTLAKLKRTWPARDDFIRNQLPARQGDTPPEDYGYIDGSILANAPFSPAIAALRQRPARREVDRRFVYIEPRVDSKPASSSEQSTERESASSEFFSAIISALSTIPRQQPIRNNVEMLSQMSARIIQMQDIIEAMRAEVEEKVTHIFGSTFFLDSPTPQRLKKWRAKAQQQAAEQAGYSYAAYGHLKMSVILSHTVDLVVGLSAPHDDKETQESASETEKRRAAIRAQLTAAMHAQGLARVTIEQGEGGAHDNAIRFFKQHDVAFRMRRLRFLARELDTHVESKRAQRDDATEAMRRSIFEGLAPYTERHGDRFYQDMDVTLPSTGRGKKAEAAIGKAWLAAIAEHKGLEAIDHRVDALLAEALAGLDKGERRRLLLSYLGYPFYDIASLPLLEGEGLNEFDPIKIDRVAPADATPLCTDDMEMIIKGSEFKGFGAFFSRIYRENDYLWGRLHGADRFIDIIVSSLDEETTLPRDEVADLKQQAFLAILNEEEERLTKMHPLIAQIRTSLTLSI